MGMGIDNGKPAMEIHADEFLQSSTSEKLTCLACEHKRRKEHGPTAFSGHRCILNRQGFPHIGSKCAAFLSETREGWRK